MHRDVGLTKVGKSFKLKQWLGQSLGVTFFLGEKLARSLLMGGGAHMKLGAREVASGCGNGQSMNHLGGARDWHLELDPCGLLVARG